MTLEKSSLNLSPLLLLDEFGHGLSAPKLIISMKLIGKRMRKNENTQLLGVWKDLKFLNFLRFQMVVIILLGSVQNLAMSSLDSYLPFEEALGCTDLRTSLILVSAVECCCPDPLT